MHFDLQAWARRRGVRATAMTVLVLGPVAAVPVLMATSATAADGTGSTAGSTDAQQGAQADYPGGPGSAARNPAAANDVCASYDFFVTSVDAATGTAVFGTTNGACNGQTVSVVAYEASSSAATYSPPQQRFALTSVVATVAGSPYTVHLAVPQCFDQLDIILGTDAPPQLTGPYFFQHNTLIGHDNGGTTACTTTTTTSAPPTTTSATTSTTTATSSTTTVTTATTSVTTSTSTSHSDGPSTAVLPFSTSRAPVVYVPTAALPDTGVQVPVRAGLLAALGLLTGGAGLVLLAGARGPAGAYRRR